MADDHIKFRTCEVANCNVRMSAIEKDRHMICPSHTGWQCNWEQRCNVCKEWPDQEMRDYLRWQEGKARKKAHKDRKKALKLAAGKTPEERPAHSLSPLSISSSEMGEIVSSPFVDKSVDRRNFNLGEGKSIQDKILHVPPVLTLPH